MNTIIDFINMQWVANLGWSLLHTLWQGTIITLITLAILRFIPTTKSSIRYSVSLIGMTTIVVLFIGTFIFLQINTTSNPSVFEQTVLEPTAQVEETIIHSQLVKTIPIVLTPVYSFINAHIHKIFIVWAIGVTLLFVRLIGAFWYIEKIKRTSRFLSGELLEHLNQLAYQFHIPRWIELAENKSITSPIVVGIIKPIILLPVGMLSGLSMEQVESIFIHELIHIKRHDYLVNIFQSIVEVVLFFNPFVMILSNQLRKERENCCDDVVLEHTKNPALYARTLAQLEEYKYTNNQLAISLAGNKNYLLNRIKRIMERTAKKQNGKGRFLPIILLVVGLISASWLSFTPVSQEGTLETKNELNELAKIPTVLIPSDTIKPLKKIEPVHETQEPFEVEDFEMDVEEPMAFNFDFEPPVFEMDPFEFDFEPMEFNFSDTIPSMYWEKFGEEFSKNFQENFTERYSASTEELKRSMEALEKTLSQLKHDELISREVEEKIRQAEKLQYEKLKELEQLHKSDVWELQEKKMKEVEEKMRHFEAINKEKFAEMEVKMKAFEKSMKAYEKELKEELIKDGYIKKGDEVTIHWKNEDLEINGKKLKEKDQQKYKDLQKKYFKEGSMHMNWE